MVTFFQIWVDSRVQNTITLNDFYFIWQTEKRQMSAYHKVNLWEESLIIIYYSRQFKILLRNCRFWTKECLKKAHFTDKRCLMNKFRKIQSSTESTLWNILTSLHALPLSSRGRVEKESGNFLVKHRFAVKYESTSSIEYFNRSTALSLN